MCPSRRIITGSLSGYDPRDSGHVVRHCRRCHRRTGWFPFRADKIAVTDIGLFLDCYPVSTTPISSSMALCCRVILFDLVFYHARWPRQTLQQHQFRQLVGRGIFHDGCGTSAYDLVPTSMVMHWCIMVRFYLSLVVARHTKQTFTGTTCPDLLFAGSLLHTKGLVIPKQCWWTTVNSSKIGHIECRLHDFN